MMPGELTAAIESADALLAEPESAPLVIEWWGTGHLDKSTRSVHVQIGPGTLVSTDRSVQWARIVINAMVFGLSRGKFGSPVQRDMQPKRLSTHLLIESYLEGK